MGTKWIKLLLIVVVSLAWTCAGFAAEGKRVGAKGTAPAKSAQASKQVVLTPDELQWKDGPAELGNAKVAMLEGNPNVKGFFAMRVKLPAGTKIAPHVHDDVERVTVISGKLYLAMGEKQQNPTVLPAGSYFALQPGTLHNAWADEETVLQIATIGRWTMRFHKATSTEDNTLKPAPGKRQ